MVTRVSKPRPRPRTAVQQRPARLPVDIRIEVATSEDWFSARSKRLGMDGIAFESGEQVPKGRDVNPLLYLPRGEEELDLVRVQSQAVTCTEKQGLFSVATDFRRFAPGDERRLRDWLLELVRGRKRGGH